uniref:Uncharacterized protein n=1 Tax=Rhizophora mucronata TaxID=61149 RepID=A0A2P2QFH1_RHIMU
MKVEDKALLHAKAKTLQSMNNKRASSEGKMLCL